MASTTRFKKYYFLVLAILSALNLVMTLFRYFTSPEFHTFKFPHFFIPAMIVCLTVSSISYLYYRKKGTSPAGKYILVTATLLSCVGGAIRLSHQYKNLVLLIGVVSAILFVASYFFDKVKDDE